MAVVVKTSILTGRVRKKLIPEYTQAEFERRYIAWKSKRIVHLEECFPDLDNETLLFLRNGSVPEEYDDH